ncbi:MAG: hypothetical protein ACE5J4_03125 [Candidatus Aenigmatarchaeota archaeon]
MVKVRCSICKKKFPIEKLEEIYALTDHTKTVYVCKKCRKKLGPL